MKVYDEEGHIIEVDEVGIPGLFPVTEQDIAEELQNNEALIEFQREQENL